MITAYEWAESVAWMRPRWPNSELTDAHLDAYLDDLQRHAFTADTVRKALRAMSDSGQYRFLPTVGQLVAQCHDTARYQYAPKRPALPEPDNDALESFRKNHDGLSPAEWFYRKVGVREMP